MQSAPERTSTASASWIGLPVSRDFDRGDLAIARAQVALGAMQNAAALGAGHRRPDGESRLRRGHGLLDFGGAGLLDAAEDFARGGIDVVERFAGRRGDVAAADVALLEGEGFMGAREITSRTRCGAGSIATLPGLRASRMEMRRVTVARCA